MYNKIRIFLGKISLPKIFFHDAPRAVRHRQTSVHLRSLLKNNFRNHSKHQRLSDGREPQKAAGFLGI